MHRNALIADFNPIESYVFCGDCLDGFETDFMEEDVDEERKIKKGKFQAFDSSRYKNFFDVQFKDAIDVTNPTRVDYEFLEAYVIHGITDNYPDCEAWERAQRDLSNPVFSRSVTKIRNDIRRIETDSEDVYPLMFRYEMAIPQVKFTYASVSNQFRIDSYVAKLMMDPDYRGMMESEDLSPEKDCLRIDDFTT
jgi:hypothetical protein